MKKFYSFILAAMFMCFAAPLQGWADDLVCHFYIPAARGFASSSGCAVQWYFEGSEASAQVTPLVADTEASSWYTVTIPRTDGQYNSLYVTLLNASTAAAATRTVAMDETFQYWDYTAYVLLGKNADGTFSLYKVSEYASQYPYDYLAYNLQAHQSEDTLYVSWESNDDPGYWNVDVYDDNGNNINSGWIENPSNGYVLLPLSKPTKITWRVRPNVSWDAQQALFSYGDSFTAQPSPKLATNLKATLNADGTYTFSWTAAKSPLVKQYTLSVHDANGNRTLTEYSIRDTSITRPINALFSGKYTMELTSYDDRGWNSYGTAEDTFIVAPLPAHDITVRIMLGAMSGVDTTGGVQFDIERIMDIKETVNATKEPYGWYSYTFNTTEPGARVGVKRSGYYYTSMTEIYGDTCMQYSEYNGYRAAGCNERADDYVPHDILATPNEDGTYTISWLMDATARVSTYRLIVQNITTGQEVLSRDDLTAAQANTPALEAGSYNIRISVYEKVPSSWGGYDNYLIGEAMTLFTVAEKPARDIVVRVLPQPGAGEWGAYTYNADDWEYTTPVPFVQESDSPWFTYTFNTTSPAVNVMFKKTSDMGYGNGGQLLGFTQNTCVEFENEFRVVDCSTTLKDYTVSNPQREDLGNGKMKFTWQCAANPQSFLIYLNDANDNPFKTFRADGADREFTATVNVDSTMATVKWFVVPQLQSVLFDKKADGAPFSLTASPYVPSNIVVKANGDATWTITWDSCPAPVNHYTVYNSVEGYTTWVNKSSYTTPVIADTVVVTITITSQTLNGEDLGSKSVQFTVRPVAARDITVRLLIHPDANDTTARDVYLEEGEGQYISPVREGNGWLSYTFSSSMPAAKIRLQGYPYSVAKDTCFEYSESLNYAACDAQPHDYRLIEGSLKATSLPGRAIFSWASVEKSARYTIVLEYYESEYGYWNSFVYESVQDTTFTYMVPDKFDGRECRWYVYPSSPHYLYNKRMYSDENVTLHKSAIELSNFKITTTDSINYRFSWASNTDTVQYQFEIAQGFYGNNQLCSVIQKGKTYDYTFISGQSSYQWRVRAVNAAGEPLTQWEESDNFRVKSSLRALSNLQGTASGRTLNYTWSKTTQYVKVFVECETSDNRYELVVSDTILTGNSLSVNAELDGRYTLYLMPVIQNAQKNYVVLNEELTKAVSVFASQTYHVSVIATTGGQVMPDVTGDYPLGYEINVWAREEEGYRFKGWSDGNNDRRRTLIVAGDTSIIALFVPVQTCHVVFAANNGGKIVVGYSSEEIDRLDTTVYADTYFNLEARPAEGYTLYQWSDGYDNTQLTRGIDIQSDTTITAIFQPICFVSITAGEGGRVQVSGAEWDNATNKYKCAYGTELTLKANPDEGYRFTGWSDGDHNVTRTYTVTGNVTLTANFEVSTTPLNKYTVRVLSSDTELGTVSQVSGTYTEGDQLTIIATPVQRAEFVKWSDGNTEATRVITVTSDTTLIATFAVKRLTLTISAGEGGAVNTDVNGTYDYGTQVTITATPNAHYTFIGWSDGNTNASRIVDMTENITLTANFAQETYLVTFLNADGSLIEANPYHYGETPVCSVTPTMEPTDEWTYTFIGWDPAIVPVTGNAVYTAKYEQTPIPQGVENTFVGEQAVKRLINGQLFIFRGDKVYTITGQEVR